jgi:hypothetical protein
MVHYGLADWQPFSAGPFSAGRRTTFGKLTPRDVGGFVIMPQPASLQNHSEAAQGMVEILMLELRGNPALPEQAFAEKLLRKSLPRTFGRAKYVPVMTYCPRPGTLGKDRHLPSGDKWCGCSFGAKTFAPAVAVSDGVLVAKALYGRWDAGGQSRENYGITSSSF